MWLATASWLYAVKRQNYSKDFWRLMIPICDVLLLGLLILVSVLQALGRTVLGFGEFIAIVAFLLLFMAFITWILFKKLK